MFESSSQGITEIEGFFLVFEKRIFLKFVRIILFFFSKLFVEIVLEFCNSRNETIGSCFIIFSPRENMKIFILISTEEFSIRESIISRSVFFSYFLRVIRGRFTFSEGRTNFLKCCTFNEL